MKTSLTAHALRDSLARLHDAERAFGAAHPGEGSERSPVHVVYGGAHLFRADTPQKLGRLALKSLEALPSFDEAFGLSAHGTLIRERVAAKLASEPVEDLRVDFEDGYGHRSDDEEDADALRVADEVHAASALPFSFGIRIKPLSEALAARALRTLDLFVSRLASLGPVRPLLVTLPKVTLVEQVELLTHALSTLERTLSLPDFTLRLELMVETPQAIVDDSGRCPLSRFVHAAQGRCEALHFGTYDYTAACGIVASHQKHDHPAADFARTLMQNALAGSGVRLSDGATNVLPVAVHRGEALGEAQQEENRRAMLEASRLHFDNVTRSLRRGFYQGWDLHPAQLPVRYAATYAFFLEGLEETTKRLRKFLSEAAQATTVGTTFDDAATGQGLLNFFLRGLACGALGEEDVKKAGLSLEELQTRSFLSIVSGRRQDPR